MRGVFDEMGRFSLLVLGLARCAELLRDVMDHSLFSGIMTEHAPGVDVSETRTLLQRHGADPNQAPLVNEATGGHPEWTSLVISEVRAGRITRLAQHLADRKVYRVIYDRLVRLERGRLGSNHAASSLEKLLSGAPVMRLENVCDDLSYPEVRLYYDGLLVERDGQTTFRCEAARLAAKRAVGVWKQGL
jgi:hypothetical protein